MFAYIVIEQYIINIYKCLLYVYLFIFRGSRHIQEIIVCAEFSKFISSQVCPTPAFSRASHRNSVSSNMVWKMSFIYPVYQQMFICQLLIIQQKLKTLGKKILPSWKLHFGEDSKT